MKTVTLPERQVKPAPRLRLEMPELTHHSDTCEVDGYYTIADNFSAQRVIWLTPSVDNKPVLTIEFPPAPAITAEVSVFATKIWPDKYVMYARRNIGEAEQIALLLALAERHRFRILQNAVTYLRSRIDALTEDSDRPGADGKETL